MSIFSPKTENSNQPAKSDEQKSSKNSAQSIPVPTILESPRISEKSNAAVKLNKYIFNVKLSANKVEVKKAVEKTYKVKVLQVNIIKMEGKNRNYGRTSGKMSDFKKAIVTLKQGDKIEGVTEIA